MSELEQHYESIAVLGRRLRAGGLSPVALTEALLATPGAFQLVNPDRALAAAQAAESSLVAYVSPEQAQGMAADQQSDLYSLGLMLHEMLTGTRPYLGETVSALLFQHIYAPVPDLPAVIPLLVEHPPYANLRDSVHV